MRPRRMPLAPISELIGYSDLIAGPDGELWLVSPLMGKGGHSRPAWGPLAL